MEKTVLTSFTILCLSSTIFLMGLKISAKESPDVIYVPTDYSTIQEAINHANSGDTIYVYNRTYYEHVVVNKSVSLIGEGRDTTIIDSNGRTALYIDASHVNVSGFTLRNSKSQRQFNKDYGCSIYLSEFAVHCGIYYNRVYNASCGIYLDKSGASSYAQNNISNNSFDFNVYGILLDHSKGNTINRNNITEHLSLPFHVYGHSSTDYANNIENNTINGKLLYYLFNLSYSTVSPSKLPHASWLFLANSSNITCLNLDLSGLLLALVKNSTISNSRANYIGLQNCIRNIIQNNTVILQDGFSSFGIELDRSHNSTFESNMIQNCWSGFKISSSYNNIIRRNSIQNNTVGVWFFEEAENNMIYHNSFIDNDEQIRFEEISLNAWDNGHPSGGNYWSDYNGTDLYSGPYQNVTGSDGIGDTPYIIDENNADDYPLIGVFSDFNVTSEYNVQAICNSTISDIQFNGTAICFNVTGDAGTVGFCRICIPTALMNDTYRVFVNSIEVPHNMLPCSNSTHSYLYFTYPHSTKEVVIIPEFPSFLILPLFMMITLLAVIFYRRKHSM